MVDTGTGVWLDDVTTHSGVDRGFAIGLVGEGTLVGIVGIGAPPKFSDGGGTRLFN